MERRQLLAAVAGASVGGLAGCSVGVGDGTDGSAEGTDGATMGESATRTEPPSEPSRSPPATPTGTRTTGSGGGGTTTVIVAPDGRLVFSPDSVTVAVGDTVRFRWDDDGHNVKPSVTADESGWEGTPGDRGVLYDTGYVHEHTFAVTGEFPYECVVHAPYGMLGEIVVE